MDILHCDLDAFYASVEQRDNPSLQGKPVIIGALPGNRGVVATCSYEARKYGVHSAMPISEAYRLCPEAIFIKPDLSKYLAVSRQVFSILESFTPLIEKISVDEAFLDVSGCHNLFGCSQEIALEIKKQVWEKIGIKISIGIASNKFLAKLASSLSKPDGLLMFTPDMVQNLLPSLPVQKIWGIGPKTVKNLNNIGIYTISDLLQTEKNILNKILGSNTDFILQLAQGKDSRPIIPYTTIKSIGHEITFPRDINDIDQIKNNILNLSGQVGLRLRRANLRANTVTLKVRLSDFTTLSRSQTLDEAFNSNQIIFETALYLLGKMPLADKKVRLIGINCSNFSNQNLEQLSLFSYKTKALDQIIDQLKIQFPYTKITPASLLKYDIKNNLPDE